MASESSNNKKIITIVVAVLVTFLVLGAIWFAQSAFAGGPAPDRGKYQALFLTNGQVYFGKLSDVNKEYVKISDIYYLQVQQAVQPEQKKDAADQQPQTSLVKLGNELHGPQDEMYVARDQVLFWENLKDDGKVVKAIKENQAKE